MLTAKNRKRQLGYGQEMEDRKLGEGKSGHSVKAVHAPLSGQFIDGCDDDLMCDAEDPAHLGTRGELERESELCDRTLECEELLSQWGINGALVAKEKKSTRESQDVPVALKKHPNTRRLKARARRVTRKRRAAIDRSVDRRNSKRAKEDLKREEIASDDQESGRESDGQHQHQHHDHDHHLKWHEQSRGDFNADGKKSRLKVRDVYSDECSGSEDDEREIFIRSLKELTKAVLTRTQLESFLDKPIFEETVIGCFVRFSVGSTADQPSNQPAVYRLGRIVAVMQCDYEYLLGSHRTRRVLQLQHGVQVRNFQMDAVSNQPVSSDEFAFWLDACQRDAQPLPSVSSIGRKQKDIEMATNFFFTEGDVEPVSGAYSEPCFIMEHDLAVDCDDVEKATWFENQIEQIDETFEDAAFAGILSIEPSITRPQCMPFRHHEIADLNSLESRQEEHSRLENTARISVESEESNLDMLDLYELHNFEVNLDLSKLMQFSEIFNEIAAQPWSPISNRLTQRALDTDTGMGTGTSTDIGTGRGNLITATRNNSPEPDPEHRIKTAIQPRYAAPASGQSRKIGNSQTVNASNCPTVKPSRLRTFLPDSRPASRGAHRLPKI